MTWKDFKEKVEAAGVKDKSELGYIEIDFTDYKDGDEISIEPFSDGSLCITCF